MTSIIEYWRGYPGEYGWPLDDPATGEPMEITGLEFRIRVLLPAGELVLPAYGATGRPFIAGKEIDHPAVLMVDIAPDAIAADPGGYTLVFEVNDGTEWRVMPIRGQSINVR